MWREICAFSSGRVWDTTHRVESNRRSEESRKALDDLKDLAYSWSKSDIKPHTAESLHGLWITMIGEAADFLVERRNCTNLFRA